MRAYGTSDADGGETLRPHRHVIKVENYSKAYDRVLAVDGLDFAVDPGQILGMLGRNGAGKTTTLRALAGIVTPTQGRLWIAGHDLRVDPVSAKGRLLGWDGCSAARRRAPQRRWLARASRPLPGM